MERPALLGLDSSPRAGLSLFGMSLRGFFILAGCVLLADQLTKIAVLQWLSDGETITIIPSLLQLNYATNTGAAFSVFRDYPAVLTVLATAVAIALAVWSLRLQPAETNLRWPLGLILGGATGNLTDRYRLGHVVDFIDAHWFYGSHFPTFNVADSAICIGMGLLILLSFISKPEARRSHDPRIEST